MLHLPAEGSDALELALRRREIELVFGHGLDGVDELLFHHAQQLSVGLGRSDFRAHGGLGGRSLGVAESGDGKHTTGKNAAGITNESVHGESPGAAWVRRVSEL